MGESSKTWLSGTDSSAGYNNWCQGVGDTGTTVFDLSNNCWTRSQSSEHHFICVRTFCHQDPPEVANASSGAVVVGEHTKLR